MYSLSIRQYYSLIRQNSSPCSPPTSILASDPPGYNTFNTRSATRTEQYHIPLAGTICIQACKFHFDYNKHMNATCFIFLALLLCTVCCVCVLFFFILLILRCCCVFACRISAFPLFTLSSVCCTENADNEQFNSEPRLAREKINVINKITNIYLFFSATVYGYMYKMLSRTSMCLAVR